MSDDKNVIREAMSIIGSRRSEAKTAAARENARRPRPNRKGKPIEDFPCTCGGCPDNPKTTCPRGRTIRRRNSENSQNPVN